MMDALITIMVEKSEVLTQDVSRVRKILDSFLPTLASRNRNNVVILVNGYDDDSRELFLIAEVRTWFHRLFDAVPELFFWMDMHQQRLPFYALMMGEPVRGNGGTTVSSGDMGKFMLWGYTNLNEFCARHNFDATPSNSHILSCLKGDERQP
jgi:hypothetical protein